MSIAGLLLHQQGIDQIMIGAELAVLLLQITVPIAEVLAVKFAFLAFPHELLPLHLHLLVVLDKAGELLLVLVGEGLPFGHAQLLAKEFHLILQISAFCDQLFVLVAQHRQTATLCKVVLFQQGKLPREFLLAFERLTMMSLHLRKFRPNVIHLILKLKQFIVVLLLLALGLF